MAMLTPAANASCLIQSVTIRYRVKTAKHIVEILSSPDTTIC